MTARSSAALEFSDAKLWRFVRKTLYHYAREFDLPLRKAELLPPSRHDLYGDCSTDGVIRIQVRRGKRRLFAYQIIDTMAHELAHLKYPNHKWRWFDLHVKLLAWMAGDDLYRRLRKQCKGP